MTSFSAMAAREHAPGPRSKIEHRNFPLDDAMDQLSMDERDAIRMIIQDGKSYTHAAEALGVTVTTINNWKHRGLAKLKKLTQSNVLMPTNNTVIG